jgi:guanylate kinase
MIFQVLFFIVLVVFLLILFSLYYIKSRNKEIIQKYISLNNNSKTFKNKPLMIIGPSGVGKDTYMQLLISKYPKIFKKCVSCTTRAPRANEIEGINYYYITKEKFLELEKNGDIIGKFEKYNNLYGTSKQIIEKMLSNDEIIYFDYNIETAIKIFNDKTIEFNYIALLPPNIEELEIRLKKRGTDNEESIKKRISYANKEIELINKSKFINHVIVNDVIEKSFQEFELCVKKLYSHILE